MTFKLFRPRVAPNVHTENPNVLVGGPYTYHQGDYFPPGAAVFAWDNPLELLPQSVFGRGGVASVCCRKFTFGPRAQQVGNVPTVTLVTPAQGGVLTGTFGLTSLSPRSGNL